ncbi:hypothetical protein ACIBUY_04280 [Streptomyces sp. NPDC050085]|uniref:hypothetical protein n=1 Tax=Streptomyces sp. NPDC050085 TaxID=3365600 RepID=UPI00378BA441
MAYYAPKNLRAAEFFARLHLPFGGSEVVGDTYYVTPHPGSVLRLRISFHQTIKSGEYDGLVVALLHPEHGTIDSTLLTFLMHETFAERDTARQVRPGHAGHATFDALAPQWAGADLGELRRAIERYARIWSPTTALPSPPAVAPSRTATPRPSPPAGRTR